MNKIAAFAITATMVIAPTVAGTMAAEARTPKACHTAYTVFGHNVAQHTVKASAKHSAYTVSAHTVATHVVKANCSK